tara:strand:- start:3126 stop:3392 length:267 start_codon:yes stop_codon:yes gene_type:complete
MDKNLIKYFIQECIDVQDWEAKQEANYIEMNEWFKYSGRVEKEKHLYEFNSHKESEYIQKLDNLCDAIHNVKKEIKNYENINKNGHKQ